MLATLTVIACAITAALLVRAHLLWSRETAVQSCARCHTPAAELTDFTCPGCGHDVRERGLAAWTRGTPAATLAAVSSAILVAAIAAGFTNAGFSGPRRLSEETKVFQYDLSFSPTGWMPHSFANLHVVASGTSVPGEKSAGDLWLDLFLNDGNISTLRVTMPSLAMRAWRAGDGKTDYGRYGPSVLDRWLESAGIDDAASRARYARELYDGLTPVIDSGAFPHQHIDMHSALMGGGGGGTSSQPREFLPPLLLLTFSPIGLGLIGLALSSQRRRALRPRESAAEISGAADSHCGACGYSTTGLQTLTCPECGNDLRTSGITLGSSARPLGVGFLAGIYFTFVTVTVGILLITPILDVLPAEHQYTCNASVKSAPPNQCVFNFFAARRKWSNDTAPIPVNVVIQSNPSAAGSTLTYDPQTDMLLFPAGKSRPFKFETLLSATKSAGVDITDLQVIAQAKEAMSMILISSRVGVIERGTTRSTRTQGTSTATLLTTTQPPMGAKPALLCGLGLVWLLGLRELWRKPSARAHRAFTPSPTTV